MHNVKTNGFLACMSIAVNISPRRKDFKLFQYRFAPAVQTAKIFLNSIMQASECKAHSFPQFYQLPVLVCRVHPPQPTPALRREKDKGTEVKIRHRRRM